MTKPTFDMDAAITALKAGKGLTGKRVFNILCHSLKATTAQPARRLGVTVQ